MKIAVVEDSLPVRRLLVKRAEHEAGVTVVAQASVVETAAVAKPSVSDHDRRMVRIALGMIAALAIANLVLYLPRVL